MKIQKDKLAQKINKLKSVVPKKTNTPVLQGILVKDGYLIANNGEMTVKAKLEGTENESLIIPMRAFDLINNLPDGEIQIVSKGKDKIKIKTDNIENTYKTLNPDEYPVIAVNNGNDSKVTISSKVFLDSIKRVSFAIPAQFKKPVMTSLCLEAADGKLNFVGTDSHILAWDKIDYEGDFKLLIPKNAVDKILAVGITGDISIQYTTNSAMFVTEEYEIYTRLIEGEYFRYQTMFDNLPMYTVVTRMDLLNAMIRANTCIDEKLPVRFDIKENLLDIYIKDSTTNYHETIFLQEPLSSDLVIGFNAKLVSETLRAFDCKNIAIQLAGPKQPMIIEAEDNDFKALILPVAIS